MKSTARKPAPRAAKKADKKIVKKTVGKAVKPAVRSAKAVAGRKPQPVKASKAVETLRADMEGQIAAINRSQAVIEFQLDGTIIRANDNFLATVGYTLDEIRGQHHSMFVAPEHRASVEYRAFWEKLARGEYDAGQYQRFGKHGKEIWIQASYNPILDRAGKPLKVVKYATEITVQKRAQLAAQAHIASSAADNARVRQGLDVVATNVMVSDADLNIVYVNQSIREMLAAAEADIRKDIPAFSAATVVGTNIDVFHKNPAHQRGLLARMTGTHSAKLKIGGRTFSLILNPINGAQNERLGYVVEWRDMTADLEAQAREAERQEAERRLANENLRIKNALDNVTANVMIANNDREIIYINAAVSEMLQRAESELRKTLPHFDARKLLGANIDVFHKNPQHQTQMLAKLSSAYKTEIKVSGLTFGLIASPIVNDKGERLGTVVEWRNRTAEVAVEAEIGAIVSAAANGEFGQRIDVDGKDGFFRTLAESINALLVSMKWHACSALWRRVI